MKAQYLCLQMAKKCILLFQVMIKKASIFDLDLSESKINLERKNKEMEELLNDN